MDGKHQTIDHILSRNTEEVLGREHLRAALESGKKLRVKLGIDPTSPDLHLGHAVVLNKLRQFQDLGHTAILIIGDFTARIGDPSGRDKTRPPLTEAQIKENMKHYLSQAKKVIDVKKAEVRYNSEWFGKMKAPDVIRLMSLVSLQQIIERDDFKKRFAEHQSIRMHELFYPVLQGYDSVAITADVELGGADQLFNVLMGRAILEAHDMPAQDILTVPLLIGLDGEKKMSKSLGNYVGLDDEPNDMFGKIMSLPDRMMPDYFKMATSSAKDFFVQMKEDPKAMKEQLAASIVEQYHGEAAAKKAREHFESIFSRREIPEDVPELALGAVAGKGKKVSALDIVSASGISKSRSDARRLIEGGGFEFAGASIKNPLEEIEVRGGEAVRIGKKHFFKTKI